MIDYVHRESTTPSETNENDSAHSTSSIGSDTGKTKTSACENVPQKITRIGAAEAENPFYSLDILIPPDLS